MANLLPKAYRDGIQREYTLRLSTVGLSLLAVVLIAAIALLVPSFILTETRHQQMQTRLSSLSATSSSTTTEQSRSVLTRANRKLSVASEQLRQTLPATDIVEMITAARPAGISVRRITISRSESQNDQEETTETITTDIAGVADTRADLLAFEDNLQARAQVTAVDLPIETLASQTNAEFSLTITLQPL